MKILCFNICHAKHSSINRICKFIYDQDADIVFLGEVDRHAKRSKYVDQYKEIYTKCGFLYHKYSTSVMLDVGEYYGIALFSKMSLEAKITNISFKDDYEPRFFISGEVDTINGKVQLIFVHFSNIKEYAIKQLKYIIEMNKNKKFVICGDFNLNSEILNNEFGFHDEMDVLTWPADNPIVRIDHFIESGSLIRKQKTIKANGISDHNAISAYL